MSLLRSFDFLSTLEENKDTKENRHLNLIYCDLQFFCSLFVVTRYDVDGCLNLGPSEIGYHVHLVEHSTRVGVLLFAVLHRADESQPSRNSCPRLLHSVDSRFGLYHVAVVLSFLILRSPISLAEI